MAERATRTVEIDVLRDLMERLLQAAGCSADNAATSATVFLEADLRGIGLQGLDHMPTMIRDLQTGRIKGDAKPRIVKEGAAFALTDGDTGPGQVAALFAVDLAIRKARAAGSAAIAITNSSDVFMLGYYGERIARSGMVGIAASDAPPKVRPYGGTGRVLGTNPFVIAVPTASEHPVVLDIATSALSSSRVRQAAYHDEDVPAADGVDADGKPTVKAAAILTGAIGPLGGHKGFGLELCVALLSGPLTGSATGQAHTTWTSPSPGPASSKGHFFQAIDPAAFGDAEVFRNAVSDTIREIKDSRKPPGVSAIRVPGERAFAARDRSVKEGRVVVYDAVWRKTAELAGELDVDMPN